MSSQPTPIIEHYFTPGITIESNPDGSGLVFGSVDFADSQQSSFVKYDGTFVDDNDPSRNIAADYLDSKRNEIAKAIEAILAGKTLITFDGKPIETESTSHEGGVIVWFNTDAEKADIAGEAFDGEDWNCADAASFRKAVDKVIYG